MFILHPQKIQQYINNVYHSLRTDGLGSDQARLTIGPDMGIYVRMYLFAVLKWSVNALLNTCYPEVKHILKILSNETF